MDNENVARLIERIAPQIGAITFMEPVYRKFGMVIFQNGKRLFLKIIKLTSIHPVRLLLQLISVRLAIFCLI